MSPRRNRDERGAVALMVSLLAIVLFACAALAVDISSLAMERQRLHDHIDSAAHAGAYELPDDGASALTQAGDMARVQDPAIDPDVRLYCIVASTGPARQVKTEQIPSTCDPGPAPYNSGQYPGLLCNSKICAIPCDSAEGDKCNSVHVSDSKAVDFGFAPAIGINEGNTGAVASTACKGSCGDESPNPLDVVIMADRTPSMPTAARQDMISGIEGMLQTMDPSLHYVAFGALHKSRTVGSCVTRNTPGAPGAPTTTDWGPAARAGTWVPVPFSNDYLTSSGSLNSTSGLGRALTCVRDQTDAGRFGTSLASAMKGGARYLTGLDANNLGSLPARPGEVKKVLVFETDGSPDETWDGGSSTLTSSGDVAYGLQQATGGGAVGDQNGVDGCEGMLDVANQAKEQGITVITIGYDKAATNSCKRRDSGPQPSPYVRNYLAAAASMAPDGSPSAASTCSTSTEREEENTDGDFYFCATSGSELADIFKTAISQVTTGIKLLQLPD